MTPVNRDELLGLKVKVQGHCYLTVSQSINQGEATARKQINCVYRTMLLLFIYSQAQVAGG